MSLPKALGAVEDVKQSGKVAYIAKRDRLKKVKGKPLKNSREWILQKKERRRRQGKETRDDSK